MVGPAVLLAPLDERIAVTDGGDPRRLRFFPDRAAFRKSIYATRVDVVRAHEELIGRTMHEDEPAAAAPDAHVTSDEERSSRDRPSIRTSRVALTASGQTNAASPDGGLELLAWSDVARNAYWNRPRPTGGHRAPANGPTRSRTRRSRASRAASQVSRDRQSNARAALHARRRRSHCGLRPRLLSMCTPDACFGYVPPLVPGPVPASSTSDAMASAGRGFPDLIALLAASVSLPPGAVQSAEQIQGLGLGLRALGMLPVRAFLERVHHVLEDDWRRAANRFDWMLTASNTVSSDWTTDVERCLQRVADARGRRCATLPLAARPARSRRWPLSGWSGVMASCCIGGPRSSTGPPPCRAARIPARDAGLIVRPHLAGRVQARAIVSTGLTHGTHLEEATLASTTLRNPATRDTTVVDLLRRRAAMHGDRTAYIFLQDGEDEAARITYADLDRRARAIAAVLQDAGAEQARALLLYPPGLEYITAFLGCLYAGTIAVPAYPPHGSRNVDRLLAIAADARPAVALTPDAALAQQLSWPARGGRQPRWIATQTVEDDLAASWRPPQLDDRALAFLQYTSGSTSTPKGVMVSHGNLVHNIASFARVGHNERRSSWPGSRSFHDMGLSAHLAAAVSWAHRACSCRPRLPPSARCVGSRRSRAIAAQRAAVRTSPTTCARDARAAAARGARPALVARRVHRRGARRAATHATLRRSVRACGFRAERVLPCYGLAEATLLVSGVRRTGPPYVVAARAAQRSPSRARGSRAR